MWCLGMWRPAAEEGPPGAPCKGLFWSANRRPWVAAVPHRAAARAGQAGAGVVPGGQPAGGRLKCPLREARAESRRRGSSAAWACSRACQQRRRRLQACLALTASHSAAPAARRCCRRPPHRIECTLQADSGRPRHRSRAAVCEEALRPSCAPRGGELEPCCCPSRAVRSSRRRRRRHGQRLLSPWGLADLDLIGLPLAQSKAASCPGSGSLPSPH